MEEQNKFEYTYSAPTETERREAEEIRKRYQTEPQVGDKLAQLKALDKKAKQPPLILSLTIGILGTLIFGGGMATVLEINFPYHEIVGVAISAVGLVPVALAYPIYRIFAKKSKEKYKDEILRLSDEILNEK